MDSFDDFEPFEEIELVFGVGHKAPDAVCGEPTRSPDFNHCQSSGKPRLDRFIAQSVSDLSRAQVQKLIEQELIFVNDKPEKASYRLRDGDSILIRVPPSAPLDLVAQDMALNVVYEDQYLIVIDKPAGMVTHPGAGVHSGTLVNALLHHCRGTLSGISGVERPGIVHRLDKDTSGLIVVAKEDFTHKELAKQLHERKVKRLYLALLEGVLTEAEGTVDQPLMRHPVKRKQMAISPKGRRAVTHFAVKERYRKFTLVECRLETGRTHQIRVHMASLGYPVVGDLVYNRKSTGSGKARLKLGLKGHALHATRLSFIHPKTGESVVFDSLLPADFENLLAGLRT